MKAEMRGVGRWSGWHRTYQARSSLLDWRQDLREGAFGVGYGSRERRDTEACFDRRHDTEDTIVARHDAGSGDSACEPPRCPVVFHYAVEADKVVSGEIVHSVRLTATSDVFAAGVNRPCRRCNLPAYQSLVARLTGAKRDVGLALAEIGVAVTDDEVELQVGIAAVKAIGEA